MCSPALNLLDSRDAAASGVVRPTLARTMESVRQMPAVGTADSRSGVTRAERLRDNVGYLELRRFAPVAIACDAAAAAMDFLATTDALVIDLRGNTGGDRCMAALLTSYLFDTEPVHIGERYTSSARRALTETRFDAVPTRRYLRKDVYVLLGPASSPLAQEFARNLERLRGATVVEERQ